MKLEKRSERTSAPAENEADTPPTGGKKPVIVYILILFVVAFLLMALSLLMHQRSNTEALGQLNDSIAAMKDMQNSQERIAELEQELAQANAAAQEFSAANETSRNQAAHAQYRLEQAQEAMDWFWQLNEAYMLEDIPRCEEILAEMTRNKEEPLSEYLSAMAADRYAEILSALEASRE